VHQEMTIRGLPRALARDGWWLGAGSGNGTLPPSARGGETGGAGGARVAILVALVLLADSLFYDRTPGISLALFTAAVFAASGALSGWRGAVGGPAALLLAASLPVVDYVQTLSVFFWAAGLIVSLVWIRAEDRSVTHILGGAGRLLRAVPVKAAKDLLVNLRQRSGRAAGHGASRRWLRSWAFPTGGVLVLVTLLADANPILSDWIDRAINVDLDLEALVERTLFWFGVGLMLWPLLTVAPAGSAPSGPAAVGAERGFHLPGLNPQSVANALVLFNLVMAAQTTMDIGYLWGGAVLPGGLSHAEYAHRGAYPLLATALLAGGFALAARPWLEERRALMPLMALWLGQNVLLCLSAGYRLRLYVDAFGLTYLRIHAGIWMGLVAIGLALIGWQIWRRHSNGWLMARTAGLGLLVLYLCSFINFAGLIARQNLARPNYDDMIYICELGPLAAAGIRASGRAVPCDPGRPEIDGWRDWGFRKWQVNRYLESMTKAGARA
jgi:hypothetical protein